MAAVLPPFLRLFLPNQLKSRPGLECEWLLVCPASCPWLEKRRHFGRQLHWWCGAAAEGWRNRRCCQYIQLVSRKARVIIERRKKLLRRYFQILIFINCYIFCNSITWVTGFIGMAPVTGITVMVWPAGPLALPDMVSCWCWPVCDAALTATSCWLVWCCWGLVTACRGNMLLPPIKNS